MKFFKNVKGFAKSMAKGIRKGMEIGEKIVNTADQVTGGALRSSVAGLTGGMSEMALKHYNKNKGHVKKLLTSTEKGDEKQFYRDVKSHLSNTKYGSKLENLEKHYNKNKDIIDQVRSSEIGRNVLRSSLKKPMIGI